DLLQDRLSSRETSDRNYILALTAVAPWASAAGITLNFNPGDLEKGLTRIDFLRTLGGPDLHRFVGRTELRRELRRIWRAAQEHTEAPVLIEGPGGIGKSLAISRFIADVLASGETAEQPDAVFHVDFDRLSLRQARPTTILLEMVRQAG